MSKRKEHIRFMKQYLNLYENSERSRIIPVPEHDKRLLNELFSLGYMNIKAFYHEENDNAPTTYIYNGLYPFTPEGKTYFEKSRYQVLKEANGYQILRDIAAFIGFLIATISGIIVLLGR